MKHWQEKRNYQHVRDEAGNVRSNIITVDGIDVEVSDEVYLAYTQLDRRERYLMEEVETDKKLSLDRLLKSGSALRETGNGEESQRRGYCPSKRSMATAGATVEPAVRSAF